MGTLKWNGRQIVSHAAQAAALAVDRTMSEAVRGAKRVHEYENQDGMLEASTDIIEHAHVNGDTVKGRWGSSANYSLFVEIGTSRIGPNAVERESAGDGNMWEIPGPEPKPGVAVEQPFTVLPPGTMEGQEDWVTVDKPSVGVGPFMEARPFLRPQADLQNRQLARRMGEAFRGEEMS